MQRFIRVSEDFGAEELEVPIESDGTLLLTTLQSIFPNATGLKFRNTETNCYRAIKLTKIDTELKFHPGDDGWDFEKINYLCVFPKNLVEPKISENASKTEENCETSEKKKLPVKTLPTSSSTTTVNQPITVDLIVLNMSPQTGETELRNYFEQKFGPLLMAEVKRDRNSGASRRFAFIRFQNFKDQMKALNQTKHKIDGQQIKVALPDYRDPSELYQENKCFVGRVNALIKAADLHEFFSQFGEIVEVSYPKKFKGYAFITFANAEVARKMCGQDFVIKGYSVCVSKSTHGNKEKTLPTTNNVFGGVQTPAGFQNDWRYSRDSWSPYVSAPMSQGLDTSRNSNFYAHSNALSPMRNQMLQNNHQLSMLTVAMGNLLNNSRAQTGLPANNFQQNFQQNYRDRGHTTGTLWNARVNTVLNGNGAKTKKNKQKKSKNAKNKGDEVKVGEGNDDHEQTGGEIATEISASHEVDVECVTTVE